MDDITHLAKALRTLEDSLADCNRCGLCQSLCPVYGQTLLEGDVSRGKLALLNNLAHEILADANAVGNRLGRCLLCGACQHACPSGVNTFEIFLSAREIIYSYLGLSPLKKVLFRAILPNPGLLGLMLSTGLPFRNLVMNADKNPQGTAKAPLLKAFIGSRHLPSLPSKTLSAEVGGINSPAGKSRVKVALFPGCLGDKAYTGMAKACIKVLDHHEVGVFLPENLVCCGLPSLASGDVEGFRKAVMRNVDELKGGTFDYIVTPCPSCAMTIRDLWARHTKTLPFAYRDFISKATPKAIDINAFLINVLHVEPPVKARKHTPQPVKVTYHDPCHLRLSLGVSAEPRALIQMTPGCRLVEMQEAARCCGCGGSFTLDQPELSEQIGNRKADNIVASGADVVATACPACMMQLADMLARKGAPTAVRHVIEIYAESL